MSMMARSYLWVASQTIRPKPRIAVMPIEKRAMPAATDGSMMATPKSTASAISQPSVTWL